MPESIRERMGPTAFGAMVHRRHEPLEQPLHRLRRPIAGLRQRRSLGLEAEPDFTG